MEKQDKITVTQPFLPPLDEFYEYLQRIWKNRILTNNGPFHQELELELGQYLNVNNVSLFSNGTLALVTAIQALQIKGEVITTPYSFVATANSIIWSGNKPVFADVDPITLNLDPKKIEPLVNSRTAAILPVHCYGNPCDVKTIDEIAREHDLRVVYDAAHAFGVHCDCGSVLNYGDASVLSFHATKVFNTFEGGAVICNDENLKRRIDQLKNFGIVDEMTVDEPGLNSKMSEVNAAFGLVQLQYMSRVFERRSEIDAVYREALRTIKGIRCLPQGSQNKANYSYFPIIIDDEFPLTRDGLFEHLKAHNVLSRKYFYPLITSFPAYRSLPSAAPENHPVAVRAASRVLCLPIYPSLTNSDQQKIIDLLSSIR